MKKRLIIEIICGILIFIVGFFVGDASAINRLKNSINSEQSINTSKTIKDSASTTETKNEEAKIYKLGEEGTSGNWNIKVLEVTETNTVIAGNSSDNVKTNDKFIVVKLELKNVSKTPVQYSANEFMLGNMKDKSQYTVNDTAFNAMQATNSKETIYNNNGNFVGVYTDVNPNTSKKTYIVFEVPKDMSIADCVLLNTNGNSNSTGFYLK